MKKQTATSICKQCGKQYDKNETGRVYGTHFIDLPYCSAICYTKAQTAPTPLEVNEGKHTPGNWIVKDLEIYSGGWHIATINPYAPERDNSEANAELIASAPQLKEENNLLKSARSESMHHIANLNGEITELKEANNELLAIAKRCAFLFSNEANYPEGTAGYGLWQSSKEAISKHSKQTT